MWWRLIGGCGHSAIHHSLCSSLTEAVWVGYLLLGGHRCHRGHGSGCGLRSIRLASQRLDGEHFCCPHSRHWNGTWEDLVRGGAEMSVITRGRGGIEGRVVPTWPHCRRLPTYWWAGRSRGVRGQQMTLTVYMYIEENKR